ncbi:hypothetical protein PMG11_02927 [Penicillium brasilianum]|uniref:Uncharacterized protein n=1 Tax=Penicillium brasilianum TaxID=104259 RepID=A0A0F7TJG4_PENBI|nr:hypothetical protein PMG11_02927 [Penicillium brasilianum]
MENITPANPSRRGPEVEGNIKVVDNKGSQPINPEPSKKVSFETLKNPHTANMPASGNVEIRAQGTVHATVHGSATVYGPATVHGPTMFEPREHPRSVLKKTSTLRNIQADIRIGLRELPRPLRKAFSTFLDDVVFEDDVIEQFEHLRSNIQLRQRSAQEFLSSVGSLLGEDDVDTDFNDAGNPMTDDTGLPELLEEAMVPSLKDERTKVEIMEQIRRLRNNPQLRQRTASEILDVLALEDKEGGPGNSPANDSGQEDRLPTSAPVEGSHSTEGLPPRSNERSLSGGDARNDHSLAVNDTPVVQPPDSPEKFFDWATYKDHQLDAKQDILENKHLVTLALYESVKVNVEAGGFNIGLEGFAKLIRNWLHKEDLLAFYRSLPRIILLPLGDGDGHVDRQRLEKLDIELFDSSKFNGSDRRLTSITYGDSKYGTITVFELTKGDDGTPKTIRPKAAMREVPKIILKKMAEGIKGGSKTMLTMPHHKIWEVTEQIKIKMRKLPVLKPDLRTIDNHNRDDSIGDALKDALSIDDETRSSRVITTVPQMIAMLHHKTELIENIESTHVTTPVIEGENLPWVRMVDAPDLNGYAHNGAGFYVIVMGPANGKWMEAKLEWK